MTTMKILAVATLLSTALATPVLARDAHKPTRHGHQRVHVYRTAPAAVLNPLDFFLVNGNQPYFDGYNGQPGYMGYYKPGFGPPPVLVTGTLGCMPGTRFIGADGRRHVCQ